MHCIITQVRDLPARRHSCFKIRCQLLFVFLFYVGPIVIKDKLLFRCFFFFVLFFNLFIYFYFFFLFFFYFLSILLKTIFMYTCVHKT